MQGTTVSNNYEVSINDRDHYESNNPAVTFLI
jgi:hypothetical protein